MRNSAKLSLIVIGILAMVLGGCDCSGPRNGESGFNDVLELESRDGNAARESEEDIFLHDIHGSLVNLLDSADGSPLYITFFASYCKACMHEIPVNNKIFDEYAEKNLIVMYAVNLGDSKNAVERVIQKYGIDYPVLLDQQKTTQKRFNIYGLPTNILINRQGEEVYRSAEAPSDEAIGKLLVN